METHTEQTTLELKKIKTKWRKEKIPACTGNKSHKWKGSPESAICLKCGYDVFDMCYHSVEKEGDKN